MKAPESWRSGRQWLVAAVALYFGCQAIALLIIAAPLLASNGDRPYEPLDQLLPLVVSSPLTVPAYLFALRWLSGRVSPSRWRSVAVLTSPFLGVVTFFYLFEVPAIAYLGANVAFGSLILEPLRVERPGAWSMGSASADSAD